MEAPRPYDTDGIGAVALGTVVWFVAFLVLLALHDRLRHDGHLWFIATALAGWLLGLLGVYVCVRRRNRLRAR